MMFSSSLIMVYMAPCFKELLPFVDDNSLFYTNLAIAGASVSHGHISSFKYALYLINIFLYFITLYIINCVISLQDATSYDYYYFGYNVGTVRPTPQAYRACTKRPVLCYR